MNWESLGEKVADFAPLLGSALGPGGSAIGALIASQFGTKNTPEAISSHLINNPEAQVKLREVELNNKARLEEIAMLKLRAELEDKHSARSSHGHSKMPAVLSVALTVLIAIVVYMLFYIDIPQGSREVLFMFLGVLVKAWDNSLQYWFGTTRSSADKTKLINRQ